MPKDVIFENGPSASRVNEKRMREMESEDLIEFLLAQHLVSHRPKKKEFALGEYYKDFPLSHFKEEDLIELPVGTMLEYGDLFLDEKKGVYSMTKLTGQENGPAYRYFRERSNMTSLEMLELDDEAYERYSG